MKHAYRPIAFYHGRVLKYSGMVDESKQDQWREEWNKPEPPYQPGVVFLDERIADRIFADTLKDASPYL